MLYQLDDNHLGFPPLHHALTDPNGLLALGGDLSPPRLISAYQHGIFPWFNDGDPLMWWSPNPRAIIKTDDLYVNRTLRKAIKRTPYRITVNSDFNQVIKQCANAPFRHDDTWIVSDMLVAYQQLHQLGYAHSIEVWQDHEASNNTSTLVGGLYGVAINGYFSGESMFYRQANASKFALLALSQLLQTINVTFIDCQLLNPFLADMGATEISRANFVQLKETAITKVVSDNFWQARELFITT